MIIAIPLDEDQKNVCVTFGRAPFFLFWDDGTVSVLKNPGAEEQGGAGIKTAQFLVDQKTSVLITVRCGQNGAEVLHEAGIEIFKALGSDALGNVKNYKAQMLEKLTHFHAGFMGVQ